MIDDMLKNQVIQPSSSPWATPVVHVEKDKTLRFCMDYQRLAITKMDVFPLPPVDGTLDLLAMSKCFTTLDLRSGYWQVQIEDSSREKTAFLTHSGLYELTVMPSGLCNALPAADGECACGTCWELLHGAFGRYPHSW